MSRMLPILQSREMLQALLWHEHIVKFLVVGFVRLGISGNFLLVLAIRRLSLIGTTSQLRLGKKSVFEIAALK